MALHTSLRTALCGTLTSATWAGALLLCAESAPAATLRAGGLALTLTREGRVVSLTVDGQEVRGRAAPCALVSLCDVTRGNTYEPGVPQGGDLATGLRLTFGTAQARASLVAQPRLGALHFQIDLQGADLPARGMLLKFAFPVDAVGWHWYDDMQSARRIESQGLYENVVGLRLWADLPEWEGQPSLRMGYSNRNFCTAITGPVGIALAVPLDRPCTFRTAYDSGAKELQILYEFALTPDFRTPNAVHFEFDLYPCDPAWGLRSALKRYYTLYPDFFKVHIREQGQWMAFTRLSEIDNANEFLFGLQEGAPEPEYDDKLGVLSCTYFTHAGMGANIPGYDPEKDPLPPYEEQVKAMEAAFQRTTGQEGLFAKVGLANADGRLDVRRWQVYAHLIAQFNLDPDLPYGAWHLERALKQIEDFKKTRNADLDGFYYDGLTAGINYRTDHMKFSLAPPLWDPVAKKPFLNNFFSSVEFARAAAERLRPIGRITMMNGALGSSPFVMPWLDVAGAETGLRISRENFNYIRTVMAHKPFLTLLKANYEQNIGRPEMELFMKRCLAYGVFPGFFDWPPSGLGPGGRYWDHPAYFERDRDLFRKYLPLCRALALAGWEPVTAARSSNPDVFVERFGPSSDGISWLTLLNERAQPQRTTLQFDTAVMGLAGQVVRVVDLVSGAPVPCRRRGSVFRADLELPADGVMALQIATPSAACAWHLKQAQETVQRGIHMRAVDEGKPARAVHWIPSGNPYGREGDALVFAGDGEKGTSARQWVMLFQTKATPITLRVRASGQDLSGKKEDNLGVRCRIAWVSPSFAHYETRFLSLPEGTWPEREFTLSISCEHPLRAIQVEPYLGPGVRGQLRLHEISVSDASRQEYVVDPRFAQWYEPVPEKMRSRLATETTALARLLAKAADQARHNPASAAVKGAIGEAFALCQRLRQWIAAEKAENGCRRALRDVETAEQHLSQAAQIAWKVPPPLIQGPAYLAPGETFLVQIAGLSKTADATVHTEPTVPVSARPDGWAITVPADRKPGEILTVRAQVRLGKGENAPVLQAVQPFSIAPPLTIETASTDADFATQETRIHLRVRNHRTRPADVRLSAQAPQDWEATLPHSVSVPAGSETTVTLVAKPKAGAPPGVASIAVVATTESDRAETSASAVHLPPQANLLRNAGFEEGAAGWSASPEQVDQRVAHSGRCSLRLHNESPSQRSQASQTVRLNQERAKPILVRAFSRAEKVSGGKDKDYSLYVDLYYTDGTPRYGITFDFDPASQGWQQGFLRIVPEKPIRDANVYLLLRNRQGTAWFDDVTLVEEPAASVGK